MSNVLAAVRKMFFQLSLEFKYEIIPWLQDLPHKLKRVIWHKYVLVWWGKAWVRKDEFHSSLDIDVAAAMEMTPQQRKAYYASPTRRRQIAHERELNSQSD